MTSQVKDEDGKAIRGGKHAGEVEEVVTSTEEAAEKGVKILPKSFSRTNMVFSP